MHCVAYSASVVPADQIGSATPRLPSGPTSPPASAPPPSSAVLISSSVATSYHAAQQLALRTARSGCLRRRLHWSGQGRQRLTGLNSDRRICSLYLHKNLHDLVCTYAFLSSVMICSPLTSSALSWAGELLVCHWPARAEPHDLQIHRGGQVCTTAS
jgi:hypothetical protein